MKISKTFSLKLLIRLLLGGSSGTGVNIFFLVWDRENKAFKLTGESRIFMKVFVGRAEPVIDVTEGSAFKEVSNESLLISLLLFKEMNDIF